MFLNLKILWPFIGKLWHLVSALCGFLILNFASQSSFANYLQQKQLSHLSWALYGAFIVKLALKWKCVTSRQ